MRLLLFSLGLLFPAHSCWAQSQQPAATPAYQPLRYDEDWSALADPAKRQDTLDALKYIPLNQRGWYVSLGGETRTRYEYFANAGFGSGLQDGNGYLLQRYLLHADWHLGARVRVFTQLQCGLANGRNGGPRPTDEDRLDLEQAFIDVKLDPQKASTVTTMAKTPSL